VPFRCQSTWPATRPIYILDNHERFAQLAQIYQYYATCIIFNVQITKFQVQHIIHVTHFSESYTYHATQRECIIMHVLTHFSESYTYHATQRECMHHENMSSNMHNMHHHASLLNSSIKQVNCVGALALRASLHTLSSSTPSPKLSSRLSSSVPLRTRGDPCVRNILHNMQFTIYMQFIHFKPKVSLMIARTSTSFRG
jgi:hypothetical protein